MSPPGRATGCESIGPMLARLRRARGLSQLRLAQLLCATAGTPTVSRHEVSRWEREARIPGGYWLGWLAVVLDTPLAALESAAAARHRGPAPPDPPRLWQPPDPADLVLALDRRTGDEVRALAHAWLIGPPDPVRSGRAGGPRRGRTGPDAGRLATMRRMDDLVGGVDLVRRVDRELRGAVTTPRATGGHRLRLVAGWAQLAGWVRADAGDPAGARAAYQVALRAAAATGDRPLAAHVLGCLSHLSLAAERPQEALLLARTGYAGAGRRAPALLRALLLHRVALAAAATGERRAGQTALAAALRAGDRARPGHEPGWLYWLDEAEQAAMAGRCLAALGRPMRAAPLLATPRPAAGPRTAALYAGWLARAYLDLGEVEQACDVAAAAWPDAIRAGSARVVTVLRQLHPLLLRHRDVTAVRGYERLAAVAARYLPAPPGRGGATPPPVGGAAGAPG